MRKQRAEWRNREEMEAMASKLKLQSLKLLTHFHLDLAIPSNYWKVNGKGLSKDDEVKWGCREFGFNYFGSS